MLDFFILNFHQNIPIFLLVNLEQFADSFHAVSTVVAGLSYCTIQFVAFVKKHNCAALCTERLFSLVCFSFVLRCRYMMIDNTSQIMSRLVILKGLLLK